MVFQGQIENGVVVFGKPVPLPEGTKVRVEAIRGLAEGFWESCSLEELAERQRLPPPSSAEEILGGWPEDELDDGFEDAVTSWRARELEQIP